MKLTEETAGICGLFCGTCPMFPEYCGGCKSDRVHPYCNPCRHGFTDCAREHDVTRCWECSAFPCDRLQAFSKEHIENGKCHHENIIRDLQTMKEIGVQGWVDMQTKSHVCPNCGNMKIWYEDECSRCPKAE